MAVGQIYKVIANGFYLSKAFSNVFYYRQLTGTASGAYDLPNALVSGVLDGVVDWMSPLVSYNSVSAFCVTNEADYRDYDIPGTLVGLREEDSQPAARFICAQFVSNRAGPGSRSARKRFPGMYTMDMDGEVWSVSVGVAADLVSTGVDLAAVISNGVYSYQPICVHAPVVPETAYVEKFVISAYNFSSTISTQNSRK